jgi:hypothetical protein
VVVDKWTIQFDRWAENDKRMGTRGVTIFDLDRSVENPKRANPRQKRLPGKPGKDIPYQAYCIQ